MNICLNIAKYGHVIRLINKELKKSHTPSRQIDIGFPFISNLYECFVQYNFGFPPFCLKKLKM